MVNIKTIKKSTEIKILEAAKEEFIIRGFDGARMQHIAEKAEINKALLHYYFRSKENLFKAIFINAFKEFIPKIMLTFQSEISFSEKIRLFINGYIDLLTKNPHLPVFIINEMHRNPKLLPEIILSQGANPNLIIEIISKEFKKNNIKHITPVHFIVNILSMCIFPFAASPIIKGVFFKQNEIKFNQFIKERKKIVFEFVQNALKK
ncbi:MAG: hypothetical protein A2X08_13105 [Bacteroidetes bacterium GWA2_32_17]|nr:MAG: hypothetical protein A2X08_13105 [Bacteroidetes bacterium GWA2_32_17]